MLIKLIKYLLNFLLFISLTVYLGASLFLYVPRFSGYELVRMTDSNMSPKIERGSYNFVDIEENKPDEVGGYYTFKDNNGKVKIRTLSSINDDGTYTFTPITEVNDGKTNIKDSKDTVGANNIIGKNKYTFFVPIAIAILSFTESYPLAWLLVISVIATSIFILEKFSKKTDKDEENDKREELERFMESKIEEQQKQLEMQSQQLLDQQNMIRELTTKQVNLYNNY